MHLRSRVTILAFGALTAAIALAIGLSLGGEPDVTAQPPTVDDRLDDVQDGIARLTSELSDGRADLSRALEELSGLRGDIAVLNERVGRLTRAGRDSEDEETAYTRAFVEQAITKYERDGREATLEFYNSVESVDGQWYLVIIDEQGTVVAHRNPESVGLTSSEVTGPQGYPVGRMVEAVASVEGAWVDYLFANPESGDEQLKHAWAVRHDGLIFLSGWYENEPSAVHDPGSYTQAYVQRAIEMHKVLGREAALEYYNSSVSANGYWCLFVYQTDGTSLAHAYWGESWLGTNVADRGVDITGYDFGADILAIEESGWVSYVFVDPYDENEFQRKHIWIVTHDGLHFGSGWYERHYDLAAEDPAGYSKVLVQQAIDLYDSEGHQATLDHYNSSDSADGEWYVFVFDADDRWIAHPTRPDLVGERLQDHGIDAAGYDFGSEFLAITDSGWVSYVFGNPATGRDEQKHTWLVRHDGLLFGAGWYGAGAD